MKTIVLLALISVLMLNLVIASYGKVLSESDLPRLEPQLRRLINSPRTKSLLASRLAESNRIETGVAPKGRLIIFDPSSIALDLFSENEVGVTIEFLFVPMDKQGVFSFLFLWEGPFPKLVDWSYWFWRTEVGGSTSVDTTWTRRGSPYYVTSDVSVQSGVTLTVEPGVEVRFKKFSDFSGIKVGLSVHGNLIAEGTEESPIVFTTSCDFEDLDQTQGELPPDFEDDFDFFPTDWSGIFINGGSGIFDHCIIEYARTNIQGSGGLQISNSEIRSGETGIIWGGAATILNNIFERHGWHAIFGSPSIISGNIITVRYAHGGIQISEGAPEIMDNIISLEAGDDTFWGRGILVHESSTPIIQGNQIIGFEHQGSGIHVWQESTPNITENTITDCGNGISLHGFQSTPQEIHNNNIFGNSWGISSDNPDILVDAEDNWWGDASGPYHPTENPGGIGNPVTDYVDFTPWLTEPVMMVK